MDALTGGGPPEPPQSPARLRLDALRPGQSAVIVALERRRGDEALAVRIAALGFHPGRTLRLVATAAFGAPPYAVEVGGRLFALGRREAALVAVERGAR